MKQSYTYEEIRDLRVAAMDALVDNLNKRSGMTKTTYADISQNLIEDYVRTYMQAGLRADQVKERD